MGPKLLQCPKLRITKYKITNTKSKNTRKVVGVNEQSVRWARTGQPMMYRPLGQAPVTLQRSTSSSGRSQAKFKEAQLMARSWMFYSDFRSPGSRVAEVMRGHGGPLPKSLDSDENFKLSCPDINTCRDLRIL